MASQIVFVTIEPVSVQIFKLSKILKQLFQIKVESADGAHSVVVTYNSQ